MLTRALLAALVWFSQEACYNQAAAQEKSKTDEHKAASAKPAQSIEKPKAKAKQKATKKADAHPDEKLDIDRKLAEYTRQLAIYTEQLAKYTRDVADFTHALVWATVVLGLLALGQGYIATKEYLFANRPRLVARRFRLHMPIAERPLPMIEFVVANVGNSKAYVTWDNITFRVLTKADIERLERQSFPPIQASRENEQMLGRSNYTPTKRLAHAVVLQGIKDVPAAIAAVRAGTADFICYGFIRYRDVLWGRYETHFFRTHREGEDEMTRHPNPDFDDSSERQHE